MRNPEVVDGLYFSRFAVRLDKPLYTIPDHVPPSGSEVENLAAMRAREEELRRASALGWGADREAVDRQYRAQRKAELSLQIRHLTTKNKLDRIRAS
ncbi:hypothetical protein DIPPA_14030 [Diplonema papillatum]|nr:hypothetical protein DIPPA_14030 [Diplonema papillatum]